MHSIAEKLLNWFQSNGRDLPWRRNCTPYSTLISEVMLQQTRVETVISYFEKWIRQFPNIKSLAEADERDIMKAWEGLGYYHRARNLYKTAQIINKAGGRFPESISALQELPGVGNYISRAIASIAFDVNTPALEVNIKRILSRLYNIGFPINTTKTEKVLYRLAEKILPDGRAGKFSQAMMDLGALTCLPKNPFCYACPLVDDCVSYKEGVQDLRPVRKKKQRIPHYKVVAAVITKNKKYLIDKRSTRGLLPGLWEFPGGKVEKREELAMALKREIMEELGCEIIVKSRLGIYKHAYSHFKVTVHAFFCAVSNQRPQPLEVSEIKWVSGNELDDFPMGKVDRLIANDIKKNAIVNRYNNFGTHEK